MSSVGGKGEGGRGSVAREMVHLNYNIMGMNILSVVDLDRRSNQAHNSRLYRSELVNLLPFPPLFPLQSPFQAAITDLDRRSRPQS